MSVNPSGGVLYQYSQYPGTGPQGFWLLAREDRSAGTGGTGGAGGTGGTIKPIIPRNLIVPAPINPAKPFLVATCPPEVADECAIRVWAYAQFGAVPTARDSAVKKRPKKRPKKAALLATGSLALKPNSKGKIKLVFSRAGRKALAPHRAVRIRIRVQVTYNGHPHVFVVPDKISAPRKHHGR
jgi:hypothetical protein